jgi:hypothetical protein
MDVAITETEERAKELLFDRKGKRWGIEAAIGEWVFQFVLLKATVSEIRLAPNEVFDWQGTTLRYNAGIGHLLIADARAGDWFCDRVICCAAAVMLTGGISDPELRTYVEGRLTVGIPSIGKRGPGRSKKDNAYRDMVIVGRLIPPLLDRFDPTRNAATKGESACSIVSKALARVGMHMSEGAVERVWEKLPPSMRGGLSPSVPIK